MSAVSRRRFLQSTAVAAGAAAVVGPAARAVASDSPKWAKTTSSSSTTASSTPSAPAPSGGDDGHPAPVGDPVIAYVNGSTVTVLSGEREVTLTDGDLARRITRAAKNDG